MGLFSRKQSPRDDMETTEDDGLVEINALYDSEKNFRRAGDRNASLIQAHHVREAIHKYGQETGEVPTWDSKADRYTKWTGKWR